MAFNSIHFRSQFPSLQCEGVYLDSAATALKPLVMIEATKDYYQNVATVLRSKHTKALALDAQYELARSLTADLINAQYSHEIIWTKGATESINLVAQGYARKNLNIGDEIIVSELEHHSNLIPWIQVAQQTGAKVIEWPIEIDGTLSVDCLQTLITPKTRIIAVTQMSNVTGFQPDIYEISRIAHQHNAIIVVDGAQGIVHHPIDMQQYQIDFYAFSAHKLYAPTGLGVLYGKADLLEKMDCWQSGGKMLKSVSFTDFEPANIPYKFEAGTPNIAAVVGFYAVLDWLKSIDNFAATHYTINLVKDALIKLKTLPDINIHSVANSSLITFSIKDIHHDDIAILLAEQDIAIRSGELCAQPLMQALNCKGVIRASFMPYNSSMDVDKFILAIENAISILK